MLSMNLREQSSLIYKFLHFLDCVVVVAYMSFLVRLYNVPWSHYYTVLAWISFALCFVSFHAYQLYRSWRGWRYYREFLVICRAWGSVVAVLLVYFFIFKVSHAYSRFVFIVWSATTPLLVFVLHALVRKCLRFFRARGFNVRRAVVVGAGDLGRRLTAQVEAIPWAGIEVVGYFDDKLKGEDAFHGLNKPILGRISVLPEYLRQHDIDYVYIALPMRAEDKALSILRHCRTLGALIFLVPDIYAFGVHHAAVQSLGNIIVLNFNPELRWKRSFDLIFSFLVVLFTLPLQLAIAMAILWEDGAPVFYRHRRITSAGRTFSCLKFRSMRQGAEQELQGILDADPALEEEWRHNFKLKNDPRVTRVGRFLRRSSLDELPQFYNVLAGQMSVVGSRPVVAEELYGFYRESAGRYCSMKPGITGVWQSGMRSDTTDYQERVSLDDWYVLNYSLANDIKIIFRTLRSIAGGNGAY